MVLCGTTNSTDTIQQFATVEVKDNAIFLNRDNTKKATKNDGLIAKLKLNGNLDWSRYYGGELDDFCNSIAIYDFGHVYLGVQTGSENQIPIYINIGGTNTLVATYKQIIATDSAWQKEIAGGLDGFLAKFNVSNGKRIWGTYLGGTAEDCLNDVQNGLDGDVFVAGFTQSTSGNGKLPIKKAIQTNRSGSEDAYYARFNYCRKFDTAKFTPACLGDSLQLFVNIDSLKQKIPNPSSNYKINWAYKFPDVFKVEWSGPNKWQSNLQNPKRKITIADTGLYMVVTTNEFGCKDTSKININKIFNLPVIRITSKSQYCKGDTLEFSATSTKTNKDSFTWTGSGNFKQKGNSVKRTFALRGITDGNYKLNVTDSNGCKSRDSVTITVGPDATISSN